MKHQLEALSDTELFQLISADDEPAFHTLYSRYARTLFHYIDKIVRNRCDSLDALQSVFLQLWRKRTAITITKTVKALLFSMAKNEAISIIRKRKPIVAIPGVEEMGVHHELQPEVKETSELHYIVRHCLATLRISFRHQHQAIVLAWSNRRSDTEIATMLQSTAKKVSALTVAKWRERGRQKVLKCIIWHSRRQGIELPLHWPL